MNYLVLAYVLGVVCLFEAAFMLVPLITALIYKEGSIAVVYLLTTLICTTIGAVLVIISGKNRKIRAKEGMIAVALSWIVMSLLGALPFFISGEIPKYVDAFFETVSGFTTTGSTILTNVSKLSYANRMWRSFTHWVGGMGVIVFILSLLPSAGGSFMNLMAAESPGPDVSKIVPKVRDTAKTLYRIYIGMTLIQLVLLFLAGMNAFDAITLTMGTAGTGGFAVRSDGFDSYTLLQTGIIAVFMLLFGINFNFYVLLLRGKRKQAFRMEEVVSYIGIILAATTAIVISVQSLFPDLFLAIHHVFFTVSSIITTTGYATVDFNLWTPIAQIILVLLMICGACAGSTGGGFKVSRINIILKGVKKEFSTLVHPRSVKKVRMDGKPIAHEIVRSVNVFLAIYISIFVFSLILIALDGKDLVTNFTSVAATLNNIGPGLGEVCPMGSFADFSPFAKLVFCFDMLAGRLELLPILLLFLPSMWFRRNRRIVSQ
ncbi:TrkH family potassium uptake protein [Ileibacterium valens]|uniref:TrkH family potassium uptake protein n=1 Tax=Ileibacterium valens TaxID=1862668 RepID=UPI0024B922F1|nr:TrkH family potassium uptake protein [Ileibacterium valens]